MNNYIISEKRLLELLEAEMSLSELEAGGVNNWEWYGENYKECLAEFANGRFTEEELDYIDYSDIARLDLNDYEKVE